MQLFFFMYGFLVPLCSAGVKLMFCWCSEVYCCSTTILGCCVFLPLFQGVLLLCQCSVFHFSLFQCSWFYSMPWSFEQSFQEWKVANLKNIGFFSKAYILNSPLSPSCLGTTLALVTLQQGCIKNSKIIFLHI